MEIKNSYLAVVAGVSVMIAAGFYSTYYDIGVFGFVPMIDMNAVLHNLFTVFSYGLGTMLIYTGVKRLRRG